MRNFILPSVLLLILAVTTGCGTSPIANAVMQNNMTALKNEISKPHKLVPYDAYLATGQGKYSYFKEIYDSVKDTNPSDAVIVESYALARCYECTKYVLEFRSNDYIRDTPAYIGRFLTSSNWNYIGDYAPDAYIRKQNEAARIALLKRGIRPKNISDFYEHFYNRYKTSILHMEGFDEDKKLWDQAVSADTIESYRNYLNTSKNSYYAAEAQQQLAVMEKIIPEYRQAVQEGIPALEAFTAKYPEYAPAQESLAEMRRHAAEEKTYVDSINGFLETEDFAGLAEYVESNPDAKFYIPSPELRLLFFGPENLKIGRIKKLIDSDIGQPIIISKVKRSQTGYKDFNMDEIVILKQWGFSDTLIASMMDVTTEIDKENQRRAEQSAMLAKQEAMLNEMRNMQQAGNSSSYTPNDSVGKAVTKSLASSAADEAGKMMANKLLDSLF